MAGSAEAASADINQQFYDALGIGDATRSEGNRLIFNIPRGSGAALAAERYTAQNYPMSYVNYASGDIGFLPSKKDAVMSAAPVSSGASAPGPSGGSGGGAIMSKYTPAPIMSKYEPAPPPYTPVAGYSKKK